MSKEYQSRRIPILIWFIVLLTALFAIWPVYRIFVNVDIDVNEGWNAYYADAAMGRSAMPLYPASDRLITNNYPPLSFYIEGVFGGLIGDQIIAGRLLSLVSIAMTALGIAIVIRQLGGDATAASVGALFFVATMCRFFTTYVGMNDPHLLGLGAMILGFAAFMRAMKHGKGYAISFLLMVATGFIKHDIFAIPMTAMVWLGLHKPGKMVACALLSIGAIVVGFALCYLAYGPDFLTNMRAPRVFQWKHALGALGYLQWVAAGLLPWIYVGITRREDPNVRLCNLLIAFAFLVFLLQKTGEGVSYNAEFELVLAVSIGVGVAFSQAPLLSLARSYRPEALRFALLLLICIRLLASTRMESVRLLADPGFRAEIVEREATMASTIAHIKAIPGDVYCVPLACYRSGKPFAMDYFNCQQRIITGKLPPDAISRLVKTGKLTIIESNPLVRWW